MKENAESFWQRNLIKELLWAHIAENYCVGDDALEYALRDKMDSFILALANDIASNIRQICVETDAIKWDGACYGKLASLQFETELAIRILDIMFRHNGKIDLEEFIKQNYENGNLKIVPALVGIALTAIEWQACNISASFESEEIGD